MQWLKKIKSFIRNDDDQTKIKWSLFWRVWNEIGRPYWKWLAAGVVCTLIAASAEAFSITLIRQVIDHGFGERDMTTLYWVGFQVVGAFAFKGIFHYAQTIIMTKAGLMGATNLRRRIYAHLVGQHMSFFHNSQTGVIVNYFTGMANGVLGLVTTNIITLVQNAASIIMMLAVMVWHAPQMIPVLLFLIPSILIPLTIITRKHRVVLRSALGADARSITHITQSILGIKTIQSFGAEASEAVNMGAIEDVRVRVGFKTAQLTGLQTPLLEVMISIGLCLALISGGYFIANGSITTGNFTVFMLALTAAYKPVKTLASIGVSIQFGLIAADALFNFLDKKPDILDAPNAVELKRKSMEVALDNVTFAYSDEAGDVLHDVSLRVEPGKVCAFVGPSGGGKTTIFNLLCRFYDTQQGGVLINGEDIRSFTLASLRNNIATVSQDVFLFAGTIAENIKYGSPDATPEQVEEAAKAANAHEFITDFPQQYENQVGERGALLSGGQKQRIAIARAILKDAPILLLDEATSALDSRSEQLIQGALKKLIEGRTTFVIAHRLSTILNADIICVIKGGRIIEKGTDAELYALGGEYKKLKDIQFSESYDNKKTPPSPGETPMNESADAHGV